MSEKLYYQLTEFLIPSIAKNIGKYQKIKIISETTSEKLHSENAVGASVSGGVDSFYTLLKNNDRKESSFNITHLTFFNAGASGAVGGDESRARYKERVNWIREVALITNKKLLTVDTNFNEFLHQEHESTHTFRTLAIPLAMQKLFGKYFFASGFEYSKFAFLETDTASYDLLSTRCISTESLSFFLSGGEASRLEKVQFISQFDIVKERLNVCIKETTNCSRCDKCVRTILALYALGALDGFSKVFDTAYFYKHKHKYFGLMCAIANWRACPTAPEWQCIYEKLKKEVTVFDRLLGLGVRLYRILRRKIYKTELGKKVYKKYLARKGR